MEKYSYSKQNCFLEPYWTIVLVINLLPLGSNFTLHLLLCNNGPWKNISPLPVGMISSSIRRESQKDTGGERNFSFPGFRVLFQAGSYSGYISAAPASSSSQWPAAHGISLWTSSPGISLEGFAAECYEPSNPLWMAFPTHPQQMQPQGTPLPSSEPWLCSLQWDLDPWWGPLPDLSLSWILYLSPGHCCSCNCSSSFLLISQSAMSSISSYS